MNRWQLRVTDSRTGNILCTTEMPRLPGFELDYLYESCWFPANGPSKVMGRYQTREEAEEGHRWCTKQLMGPDLLPFQSNKDLSEPKALGSPE